MCTDIQNHYEVCLETHWFSRNHYNSRHGAVYACWNGLYASGTRVCEWEWTNFSERVSTALFQPMGSTTPNIRTSVSSESHVRESWIDRSGPVAWPSRSPVLMCLDFFIWGTWSTWCMKPLWKQKKTSSLELPSLLVTLRTCLESSNGHDNQWFDDVLRGYRPMVAHSSSSCEWNCCN